MRVCYLLLLDESQNNNRYFRMCENGGVIETEVGRVGAKPIKRKVPASYWKTLYDRKIAEGYVDRTEQISFRKNAKYAEIADSDVRHLFDNLLRYAHKAIEDNYTVSYDSVSEKMVREAQAVLHRIDSCRDIEECRRLFKEEYIIIPRKMRDVEEMLPKTLDDVKELLVYNQDLLDVMASQVKTCTNANPTQTILDKYHISARLCTDEENENIKKHLASESRGFFRRAFRINNSVTDARQEAYIQAHHVKQHDIHYLYHGSKNMNYFGIVTDGLLLNPNAPVTGKMFGYGLYFANRAKKSINYTDLSGSYWAGGHSNTAYLAVFKVVYQNARHIQKWTSDMSSLTRERLGKQHDALFAHKGVDLVNDEIIVYDQAQATMQYLVELGV